MNDIATEARPLVEVRGLKMHFPITEGIIARPRRTVSMNVDDGHQMLRARP